MKLTESGIISRKGEIECLMDAAERGVWKTYVRYDADCVSVEYVIIVAFKVDTNTKMDVYEMLLAICTDSTPSDRNVAFIKTTIEKLMYTNTSNLTDGYVKFLREAIERYILENVLTDCRKDELNVYIANIKRAEEFIDIMKREGIRGVM